MVGTTSVEPGLGIRDSGFGEVHSLRFGRVPSRHLGYRTVERIRQSGMASGKRFPILHSRFPSKRTKPGGLRPQARIRHSGDCRNPVTSRYLQSRLLLKALDPVTAAFHGLHGMTASRRHLISTVAPAASSSFLNFAASSLFTPSLTVAGADSTRSFASLRPRPVIARTALITSTFFSPADLRATVNSVFSSAGAAAAAPPPTAATATGAAADTPNFSSIIFTRSVTSMRLMLPIASRISSFETAIVVYL